MHQIQSVEQNHQVVEKMLWGSLPCDPVMLKTEHVFFLFMEYSRTLTCCWPYLNQRYQKTFWFDFIWDYDFCGVLVTTSKSKSSGGCLRGSFLVPSFNESAINLITTSSWKINNNIPAREYFDPLNHKPANGCIQRKPTTDIPWTCQSDINNRMI